MSQHHQVPPRRRGPWNSEEDSLLLHLVQSSGSLNWVGISNKIQGRSPKQCRERYHQNLRPGLNPDPITKAEGDLIEKLVREIGKKWAEIARRLGNGRSDNAVKNWWNGSQNRRKRADHKRHQHQHPHQQHQHQHQHQRVQQQPLPQISLSMGAQGQHQHQHEHQQSPPQMAQSMDHQHPSRLMSQPMLLRPSAFFTSGRDVEAPLSSPQNYSPTSEHAPSLVSDNGSQYSTPRQPLERGFTTQLPALELPERRSLSPGYLMMEPSSAPRNRSLPPLRELLQSCPPVPSPEYGFYAQEREMFAGQVWRP